jgi:hypothetical protein
MVFFWNEPLWYSQAPSTSHIGHKTSSLEITSFENVRHSGIDMISHMEKYARDGSLSNENIDFLCGFLSELELEIGKILRESYNQAANVTTYQEETLKKKDKLEEYRWLSKASKRRVRKRIQKQNIRDKADVAVENRKTRFLTRFESSNGDNVADRLSEWRKGRLEVGADPFTHCYGNWHVFDCGHVISVLCSFCALAWDSASPLPCQTFVPDSTKATTAIFGKNYRFETICPSCPPSTTSQKTISGRSHEAFPYQDWEKGEFLSAYLDKERNSQKAGQVWEDKGCKWFYYRPFDGYNDPKSLRT